MFDYGSVNSVSVLEGLRAKIRLLEGGRADFSTNPGEARAGSVYSVTTHGQLIEALADSSRDGAWVAVVGVPDMGVLAAAEHDLNLDRTILVPRPGDAWLEAMSALIDVVPFVAVAPPVRVTEATASKVAARLRKRESSLFVMGEWPRAKPWSADQQGSIRDYAATQPPVRGASWRAS